MWARTGQPQQGHGSRRLNGTISALTCGSESGSAFPSRPRILAIWMSEDAIRSWVAPRRVIRGGQREYSDLAIEMCLTQGMVFRQPLQQTQSLMRSIAGLFGVEIKVPDFSTLSRRSSA